MRRGATSLVALVLAVLPAGPAAAVASVDGGSHVLYDGCHAYPVSYSGYSSGAAGWELSLTLAGGATRTARGHTDYTSGTVTYRVCAGEGAGARQLAGSLTWLTRDGTAAVVDPLSATLDLLARATRTRAEAAMTGSRLVVRLASREQSPSGWAPNAGAVVRLQARCDDSGWTPVATGTTGAEGRTGLSVARAEVRGCSLRAVTVATASSRASTTTLR